MFKTILKSFILICVLVIGVHYGTMGWSWYKAKRALKLRQQMAEATFQRQLSVNNEKRERAAALPGIDPEAYERESKARWEAAKARGALPDQSASLSDQGNSNSRSIPTRR